MDGRPWAYAGQRKFLWPFRLAFKPLTTFTI